jgi:hypothetical protein
MTDTPKTMTSFWAVAALSLVWNAFGAFDYIMMKSGNASYLAMFTPEQRAFFTSFPIWVEVAWAVGVWGAVAGSVFLFMRNRHAVTAFGLSLAGIAVSAVWQFLLSRADLSAIFTTGAVLMTVAIWVVAIGLVYYAWLQGQEGRIH